MATLLIVNISKIYTMELDQEGNDILFSNAYIAIHHDQIMAIGSGDYQKYIDKDTRILNAAYGIVIPGIIDVNFTPYPLVSPWIFESYGTYDAYYQNHKSELLKDMDSLLFQMMKHGITTFAYDSLPSMYEETLCSLKKHWIEFYKYKPTNQNIFSCKYEPNRYPCLDPFYQARLEAQKNIAPLTLLHQMTSVPATYLRATHIGTIKEGKQADLLILDGSSIEYVFHQISQNCLRSVIKKGNQQFPRIII